MSRTIPVRMRLDVKEKRDVQRAGRAGTGNSDSGSSRTGLMHSSSVIRTEPCAQRSTARSLPGWEQHTKRLPAAGGSRGSGA